MSVPIKSYSKSQLALMYNISLKTFSKWIKKIEPELIEIGYNRHQKIITPRQVKLIFESFVAPTFE
jgi:hypothetical protein